MNWKIILKSLKDRDMQKRIFAVVGIIVVYRFMAHIPIPLGDPQTLRQVLESLFTSDSSQFMSFVNVLSGGALANFSIMLVALGPYINASIIMQLLTKAIPKLEVLNKEGEYGRKKINQMTRMLTLPLAIIQSVGALYLVKQSASRVSGLGDITANSDLSGWILMVAAMTAASMMLMWLGELITEQNIGNGISILITVGIIASLPRTIAGLVSTVFQGGQSWHVLGLTLPISSTSALHLLILTIVVLAVIVFVVKLNEAASNLTVNYAKRVQGNRTYGGITTILPVKLITAGVIPIIFAVAFLSVPSFAGQIMSGSANPKMQEIGINLSTWFQTPSAQSFQDGSWHAYIYPITYFVLVFLFTFFYTSIAFNAQDIAENLQKQGGFIADIRSGKQTEKYLTKVVNRLTLFGALALGLLAVVPIGAEIFLGNNLAVGGTSILILVAVALDTLRKIESRALMITYNQYDGTDFFQMPEHPKPKRLSRIRLKLKKSKNNTLQ